MKENLIKKHCSTRKKIDEIAKNLGVSNVGSRDVVMNRIKAFITTSIKKALQLKSK